MIRAKKSLGQHWLTDEASLGYIAETANIKPKDTVLEIGPGHGHLTKYLVEQADRVIAVEKDEKLAKRLAKVKFWQDKLVVVGDDILQYDLSLLPKGYKIVANIPYYLTGHLLRKLVYSTHPPQSMTLLLQKEVAQRIAAQPGEMSILSISIQLHYQPQLGKIIPPVYFSPPPKVDSQVIGLSMHPKPLFASLDEPTYLKLVKAGFSSPRKKLRSSLAGGLAIDKEEATTLLIKAEISPDLRAEALSMAQWYQLYVQYRAAKDLHSLLKRS